MNEVTIKGKVHKVGEVKEFGSNGFKKHEVVVESGYEKYPSYIPIEFTRDMIDVSKSLDEGNDIEVKCRVNGREWEKDGVTRYFVSVQGLEVILPAETGDAPMPI